MKKGPTIVPLAPAHLAGLGAFQAAAVLCFVDIRLAAIPLVLFLVLCLAAPFFPRFGFYLPIVSRGKSGGSAVSITFDDGPDPATTKLLLGLLAKHHAPAAFFLSGVRAADNPGLVREILSQGHEIGNHSLHHSPALMLRSAARLREEVAGAQAVFSGFGIVPLAFRPPVGITNPRLWRALIESGMYCVNFSLRARDRGNRTIRNLAKKIIKRVRPGDIILLHDVAPGPGFNPAAWIREVGDILEGLKKKGLDIVPLSGLIRRQVMLRVPAGNAGGPNPAGSFYDSIAASYDEERCGNRPPPVFFKEKKLFESVFLKLVSSGHRVLEIGAGTGVFTLPIARQCREVTAVELSETMLGLLQNKAVRAGVSNIIDKSGDIETIDLSGTYDIICSFSCFEYVPDLGALLKKLSGLLAPGGTLYFTTSHRSLFRLATQAGNAMRQGVWLHARSKRRVRADLNNAGFTNVRTETHVLKAGPFGGMLIEVSAVKE